MEKVNCEHCDKEIDLDTESYDRNATMRCLNPICSKCEDELWVEDEENVI